ncbi:MAG: sigma-E factor negative regulatory protein [Gammaproteobacteria bacterium]
MTAGHDSPLVNEQLSAWLDDELPAEEMVLLLARLDRSLELRDRAARYSLIGSCLRDGPSAALDSQLLALSLSDRVRTAIGEPDGAQPAVAQLEAPGLRSRFLPYAAAAALALIAVVLVPVVKSLVVPGTGPGFAADGQSPASESAVATAPLSAGVTVPGPGLNSPGLNSPDLNSPDLNSPDLNSPDLNSQRAISPRRLTNYLVYHGEYSGTLSAKAADSHIVNQPAYAVAGLSLEGRSSP